MTLSNGMRLGPYEVLEMLGSGGMGEVYRARDTRLKREVAIKILPSRLSSDIARLERFEREARSASALNHPNIVTIHEVGQTDSTSFIVMELVEGKSLRDVLNAGPLPLRKLLSIAAQIADGLAKAHASGIVHRDLKPENVMVTSDGFVKILDFGLAKLTERHKGLSHATMSTLLFHSSPGTVIGTAAYMSPEQARGISVDERTDIWGLGVVLYEMASGRAPFTGETATDVVVAIVEREQPPISQHVEGVPPELERIVKKALRKDRNERYQIVKELAIDLRSLRRELEVNSLLERSIAPGVSSGSEYARASTGRDKIVETKELQHARTTILPARSRSRPWILAAAAAVILAVIGFGIYKMRPRTEPTMRVPFERIEVTKLTTNGNSLMAAISPDGKYVAYVINEAGKQSLWLRQVAINSNAQMIPPREGRYLGVAFAPDGDFIYFAYAGSDRNDAGQIYKLPVLGIGAVATRVEKSDGLPTTSHDNKQIAFIRYDRNNQSDSLVIANADGSGEQIIATRKWPQQFGLDILTRPVWTPDNKALLLPQISSDQASSNNVAVNFTISILERDLVTGAERTIPLDPQKFDEMGRVTMYPDGSGVILLAKAYGAAFVQVWQLLRDGSKRTITNDLADYNELSLRSDGSAFVTVQKQTLSRLWTLRKGETKPAPLTSGTSRYFDLSVAPDDKILYASDASGIADIYEVSNSGNDVRQLTSNGQRNYGPAVSPDNRYVVFHSNRSGRFQIWRVDRDGANPKQLTFGGESTWATITNDSKWVVYQHFEANTPHSLWRVPIDGGTPEQLTQELSIRSTISPDGKLIAFWYNDQKGDSRWRLRVAQVENGATVNTFDVAQTVQVQWDSPLRWSPDGRYLVYVDHSGGIDNLWGQPIDGGAPKQLTNFEDSRILSFGWLKDGSLVASRGVITSDVVLFKDANR
jgi:serine/threonine protein kinase/Tol biopolymer transport system component